MKKWFVLFAVLITAGVAVGQKSWKIVLQKKIVLASTRAGEDSNTRIIKKEDWKKNGYLEVSYKEADPAGWQHSIRFSDEFGNELLVKDSTTSVKVPVSVLRKLYAGKKAVNIYIGIAPANPQIMAPARIMHLATLKLP